MNDHIDTRDGWRRLPNLHDENPMPRKYLADYTTAPPRYWVREEPVPPLPTAPYTVIRVMWKDSDGRSFDPTVLVMNEDGHWWDQRHVGRYADGVEERITGFVVLSEPRAVTAKVVLNRAREISVTYRKASGQGVEEFMKHLDAVADEFGVIE